jgi:hypothetical protein
LNQVSLTPGDPGDAWMPSPGCLGCAGFLLTPLITAYGGGWLRVALATRLVPGYDPGWDLSAAVWVLWAALAGAVTGPLAAVRISRLLREPHLPSEGAPKIEWVFPLRGRWLRCLMWSAFAVLPTLIPWLPLLWIVH